MGNISKRVKYGRYYYLEYFLVGFLTELCLCIMIFCQRDRFIILQKYFNPHHLKGIILSCIIWLLLGFQKRIGRAILNQIKVKEVFILILFVIRRYIKILGMGKRSKLVHFLVYFIDDLISGFFSTFGVFWCTFLLLLWLWLLW